MAWWRRGLGSGCWRLLRPANRGLGPRAWGPCLNAWGSGRVGVEQRLSKKRTGKQERQGGRALLWWHGDECCWVAASAPVGTGNFLGFRGPRARLPPKASAQPCLSTCSSPRRRGHRPKPQTRGDSLTGARYKTPLVQNPLGSTPFPPARLLVELLHPGPRARASRAAPAPPRPVTW